MQQVVDLAVSTVEGCDFAGIFVLDGDKVITPVATDPIVVEIDALQHECGEVHVCDRASTTVSSRILMTCLPPRRN